jgi:hypothetical protein
LTSSDCIQTRRPEGVRISGDQVLAKDHFLPWLEMLGFIGGVDFSVGNEDIHFCLSTALTHSLAPEFDTTQLAANLDIDPMSSEKDLDLEIVVAMLLSPVAFQFVSYEEFVAAVFIRRKIVIAARRTQLAFNADEAERPDESWTYSEEQGFTIRQGKSLIDALKSATQPDLTGRLYSFSCYRATEYVTLLGIAQGLVTINPQLLEKLQKQWETCAIKSRKFHETFLCEYGSMEEPVPERYYVPGDRVWFRNPDERSSDITGYEGSWVFYLGGGLFSNFWKREQPYTLTTKCVEIFHWRHGVCLDAGGIDRMDEEQVDAHASETLGNPTLLNQVLRQMLRFRDSESVSSDGGCIDRTREYPRRVCPETSDIVFPAN